MYPCHLINSVPFKKNPFLGPELLWFANPDNPDDDNSAATPTPGGTATPAAPAQAPTEQAQGTVTPLVDYLKEKVPGHHGEREELMERQARWITLLGDYNGIQLQIDSLFKARETLEDDKLFKLPVYEKRFKETVKPMYAEMLKVVEGKFGSKVATGAAAAIREQARDIQRADRAEALRAVEATLKGLFRARKEELIKINQKLQEDMQERIKILKENWEEHCPKGFEEYQPGWVETCMDLLDKIQKQDISTLDDGTKKEGAVGDKLLKEYQVWWDQLDAMEDTYTDFNLHLEVDDVEKEYKNLKEKTKHLLTDKAVEKFQKNATLVLESGRKTRPLIEAKIAEWENDPKKAQDVKILKDSLVELDKKMKELEGKQDIRTVIKKAFESKIPSGKFRLPSDIGYVDIPEGIDGQVEILKQVPFDTPGRRAVTRSLIDAMKGLGENVDKYVQFGEIGLPQALEDLRLFKEGIDPNTDKVTHEMIWINPFQAAGHIWESYVTAVKGNTETNAKRGAAYLQKGATKQLTHLSKIPLIRNVSVIKSATELSSNGATEAEHAEHHRIGEFEKSYEKYPPDHLIHTAMEAGDQWELQACLKLLAKHGRVDWCAPWLMEKLNSYQKTIKIPEDRHYHQRNTSKSREMLRQAFVYIYRDEDVYKSLRNSNLSSYESKMGEFSKDWGGIASQKGALEAEAQTILDLYKADHAAENHASKADPIKFESIIRYGVEWGKMSMEARLKLLVEGIACGLLPFERGVNATDKNNNYPPYDYFDTGTGRGDRPTYDDVLEWAVYAKTPETWNVFMHKSDGVMNNKTVNERLIKTMTGGGFKMDHDDAPGIAGYMTMNINKQLLTERTQGGFLMPATGILSLATGDEFWLRMYAEEFHKRSAQVNKLEITRFASAFFMYEGILNRKVFKDKQNYFRLEPSDAAQPPRNPRGAYAKVFNVKGANNDAGVGEIISDVAQMLAMLDYSGNKDLQLLHKLVNNEIKTDNDAKLICAKLEEDSKGPDGHSMFEGTPPQNIDALYDALPKYIEYAVTKNPEKLQTMVTHITSQHGTHVAGIEHGLHHDLEHVREAALVRARTGKEPKHEEPKPGAATKHDAAHPAGHDAHAGEHPAEGHGAATHGGAHGDDHAAAAATHGGAVTGSTHGGGDGHGH